MRFTRAHFAALVLSFFGGIPTTFADLRTLYWGDDGFGTSGSWTASGADWWDGAQSVTWIDGAAAVFQGVGGTIAPYIFGPTVSTLTFASPGYTLSSAGWIKGSTSGLVVNTISDATIGATLSDPAPFDAFGFTKTGSGTLTVTGTNFFDDVRVEEGEYVAAASSAAFFSTFRVETNAALTLAPTNSTAISVGSISGSGLVHPDGQDRTVTATLFDMNDFTGRLEDNGSGTLAVEYFGSGSGRLLSVASYTGATTVSAGTLTLASAGAISGSTSITVKGGARLKLDNQSSGSSANRLADLTPVQLLSGGTLEVTSSFEDVTELAGPLTTVGAGNLAFTAAAGLHAPAIRFASFQRLEGSTLAISGSGNATLTGVVNGSDGIVTPAITINHEWAVANDSGQLTTFTGYTGKFDLGSSADHVKLADISTTVATSLTRASLNLVSNDTSPQKLTLQGTLTLTSGGLLSSGTQPGSILGGSLAAPSELIITNENDLTISSKITNTTGLLALTKTGKGTLFLTSPATYYGVTTINEGTLALRGTPSSLSAIVFGGGTLQARGDLILANRLSGVGSSRVQIDTNGYNVVSVGDLSGGLSKTGAGLLALHQTQLGSVSVAQGTVIVTSATSGSITLAADTLLDAKGSLDLLSLQGNSSLAIGGAYEVATLHLNQLSLSGPNGSVSLTIDFDIGSDAQDSLIITQPFNLAPLNPEIICFAFRDIGGLSTGVDYRVISFDAPSGDLDPSDFTLAPALIEAGWKAQFRVDSEGVTVNFYAIPEPSALALLAIGLGSTALGFRRRWMA